MRGERLVSVSVRVYMLDESRERHHVLQSHPVHHLDVVVSDQLGGGDWREAAVVYLSSHAGVKDLGWGGDRGEGQRGSSHCSYLLSRSAPSSAWRTLPSGTRQGCAWQRTCLDSA